MLGGVHTWIGVAIIVGGIHTWIGVASVVLGGVHTWIGVARRMLCLVGYTLGLVLLGECCAWWGTHLDWCC